MIQAADGKSLLRVMMHYAAGAVLALMALSTGMAAQAANVKVRPDQARIVAIAGRPAAVVVGNPLYTQVMLVAGNKLLVQGRNPGKTNVIVLDENGEQLAEFNVVVSGRAEEEVALYRQGRRSTYLCAPLCSQLPNTDDDLTALDPLKERITGRDTLIKNSMNNNN